MVFLFTVPLFLGVAICVVPLQVGGDPRLPSCGGRAVLGMVGLVGRPDRELHHERRSGRGDAKGVDLFLVSFSALLLSLLLAAICVGATVLALRAPGMTIDQTPFGAW